MPVTRHPPRRSVPAHLAHTASTRILAVQRCCLPHTAQSLGHASPKQCRARARSGDALLGLHPFLPNLRQRWHSVVRLVHRYYSAVRPLQAVHGRHTAFRLRGPLSVLTRPRRLGGLQVLVPVAPRCGWVLRLRRADEPLASHVARRVTFPFGGLGRCPEGNFRSSIAPPADALVYASSVTSRCRPQDSGSGWSRWLFSCRALASPATCRCIPATPRFYLLSKYGIPGISMHRQSAVKSAGQDYRRHGWP